MFSECLTWLQPQDDSEVRRPLNHGSTRDDADSGATAGDIEDGLAARASTPGPMTGPADADGTLMRSDTATHCCGFSWQDCNILAQGLGHFTASLSNAFPATTMAGLFFSAATRSVTQLPPADNIADVATCTLTPLGLLGSKYTTDPQIGMAILGVTAMFVAPSTIYKILTIRNKPLPSPCTAKGLIAHVAGGFEALLSAHGTLHIADLMTVAAGGSPGSATIWGNGMGAVVAAATWNAMTRVHYNGINAALATARTSQDDLERALSNDDPEEQFRWEAVINHDAPVSFCTYAYQHPGRAFNVWFAHWGRGMAAYAALVNMFNHGHDWPCNGWTLLSVSSAGSLLAFAFPGRMGLDMAGYAAAGVQFQGKTRTHNLCCGIRRRPRTLELTEASLTRTDCTAQALLCGESRSHPQHTLPMLYKRGALRVSIATISSATNGGFTAFGLQALLTLCQAQRLPSSGATTITAAGLTMILLCAGAGRFYLSIAGGSRVGPLMHSPAPRPVSGGHRDGPPPLPSGTLSLPVSGAAGSHRLRIAAGGAAGHLDPLELDITSRTLSSASGSGDSTADQAAHPSLARPALATSAFALCGVDGDMGRSTRIVGNDHASAADSRTL